LILKNNQGTDGTGGGLNLYQSSPILQNVNIYENNASKGGGIYCYGSGPLVLNSTISDNTSSFGGGIYAGAGSDIEVVNTILWDNVPNEIMIQGVYTANSAEIAYSDIEGGEEGVIISGNGTLNWLEGNIDENPLFMNSGDHPYALSDGSPCIDAGTQDTTGLNLPNSDILGNKRIWDGDGNGIAVIDMGAYEFGSIQTGMDKIPVQGSNLMVSCYPNPFSGSITFDYEIQEYGTVTLTIFNQIGDEILVLVNEQLPKGNHLMNWNAERLPAGVYFLQLKTENHAMVMKIIKL
jgi:hypothetical protein